MINIHIFVYGTLQSGQTNSHYCRNAISIEPATVCGKLYQLSAGYPALQVPSESVLLKGTNDVLADANKQFQPMDFKIHDGWDIVHGELVTFSNPEQNVPSIDRLEGTPDYYRRILVSAIKSDGTIIAAWAYIMHDIHPSAQYLPNGIWPEFRKLEEALCQ